MKMKKLQNLMQQAQQMQQQMEEEMRALRFEGSSGGVVSVAMDGGKNLLSVKIDPEAVDPEDVEMLQDLIVAAVHDASAKIDEKLSAQLGGLTSGLLG
jgi:DNA-binding YbaB/EbfC family protein